MPSFSDESLVKLSLATTSHPTSIVNDLGRVPHSVQECRSCDTRNFRQIQSSNQHFRSTPSPIAGSKTIPFREGNLIKPCEQYISSDSLVGNHVPEIPPQNIGSPNGEQIRRKFFNFSVRQEKLETGISSTTEDKDPRWKMKKKKIKTNYTLENPRQANLGKKDFLMWNILGKNTLKDFDQMVNGGNEVNINSKIGDRINNEMGRNSIQYEKYNYEEKPYAPRHPRVSESNFHKDSHQLHTFKEFKLQNCGISAINEKQVAYNHKIINKKQEKFMSIVLKISGKWKLFWIEIKVPPLVKLGPKITKQKISVSLNQTKFFKNQCQKFQLMK